MHAGAVLNMGVIDGCALPSFKICAYVLSHARGEVPAAWVTFADLTTGSDDFNQLRRRFSRQEPWG